MNEMTDLFISLLIGFGTGILFFYGLWKTINRLPLSQWPGLWFFASAIIRIGLTALGFCYVINLNPDGGFIRVIVCLSGFILARLLMTSLTLKQSIKDSHATQS